MSFRIDQLAVLNLATVGNSITAGSFVRSGGTSSQFLKADGTVDTNAYITGITSGMVTTALGYTPVPTTRTLTINGVAQDLSVDRSWTISAGVSSVTGSGSGISVSPTTGAVVISNTGVTSNVAGTGISVSGATGAVTITNTGVTSIVAGTAITISGATGAVTINNAGVTSLNGSTGALTGFATQTWVTSQGYLTANQTITLSGEASGSGSTSISVTLGNSAVIGKVLTGLSITGSTITSTDSILTAFGKLQNQVNGLIGGVIYQGTWNASTNSPALTSSVGTKGYYYVVSVAGSTNLNGVTDWKIGDWAIYNGSAWEKVDNTDAVSSVNGQTGAVVLSTTNIAEGTNLYYTDARARQALSFVAGSGAYNSSTGVITIPTNTNQLTNGAGFITGNQTITLSGDASGSGATSITVTLANSGVVAGTYNNVTVNAKGLVTAGSNVSYLTGNQTITLSGDATGSGATSIAVTLANSGVVAGTYGGNNSIPSLTIDAKGRVTSATTVTPSGTWGISVTGTAGSETLATVTGRGATTSTALTFNGGITIAGQGTGTGIIGNAGFTSNYTGISLNGTLSTSNYNILSSPTEQTLYINRPTGVAIRFREANGADQMVIATGGAVTFSSTITASSLIRSGGTSSQFLKADGSVDSNSYITSASVGNGTLTLAVSGSGLSGSASFTANQSGNTTFTVTSNATNANTASTIVFRDASGNFSAGTITAALSGNATTASTWQTARTFTIGSTGKSVNGSADVSWSLAEIGAPSTTGTGASGTWGISITGNADTVDGYHASSFFIQSGSWMGDLASYSFIRESGMQMTGGSEFVILSKGGQGYTLVDGSYYAYEAGGFYSSTNSSYPTLLGFYADTTSSVNFNTSTVKANGNIILHAGNYNSYAPTLTGGGASGTWGINITGSAASASTASSVPWTGVTAGTRTNYNLRFQPSTNDYAGFEFNTSTGGGGGYFLIRGTSDNDVYTAEGITLVADAGWLTLAQRTASSKGVRIMTGTTSTTRLSIDTSGNTTISGNQVYINPNTQFFGGYGSGSGPGLAVENLSTFARFAFWGLDFYDWNHGIQMTLDGNYVYVNNYLQAANSLRAPIFYDSDNTGYYLDPHSSSNINSITTVGRIYSNEWIQFSNYTGLYSPNNGAHFRPNSGSYGPWLVTGTRNGWSGIEFESLSNGNVSLMINSNSNVSGWHNNSYGWQFRWENGTAYVYKNSYGGGTAATVLDSSNYTSYAPSLTGSGASGTWGINITGDAATVGGYSAGYFYPANTPNGYYAGDINGNTTHQRLWGTDSVQNLWAFRPPTSIEYSLDGSTWISTSATADLWDTKIFGKWGGFNMNVGNNIGAWRYVRMTWVNFGYHFFSNFTLAHSTNGHSFNFVFYKSDLSGNFSGESFRLNGISSWPGYTFVKYSDVSGWWDTRDVRIVFELNYNPSFPNNAISVGHIGLMGSYSSFTRLYDWDSSRSMFFGNNVTASGNIYMNGSALVATQSWVSSQGYVTGGPYLPLSGGTLSGTLTIGGAVGSYIWNDGSGTYVEAYGNSTATRKIRIQGSNGSGTYAQWFADGGNLQIYGTVSGNQNFLIDSSTTYLRWNGSDRLWTGSDGTRNSGWAYHTNNATGLHWPNNNWHLMPADSADFRIHSGNSGASSLRMETLGTTRGYVYAQNDNSIGFLNSARNWSFRSFNNGDAQVYGSALTVGNSTSSDIYMTDSDETTRRIHCNSNRIGFLNSSNSWGSYCDNTGNWISDHGVYAPAFYDSSNSGYYCDPASESNLWRFTAASMTRNAINYLSINSPYTTRSVQGTAYYNGTMGWGQIDFNTIFSNWGSGFIDTWSNPGNAPGGSSHYVGIQGLHYNHQNSSQGYGFQMACAGEADNRFFWRSAWPNLRSWVEMIHSGNIGSQNVNYATTAGTASFASNSGNTNSVSNATGGTYTWTGINYFRSNLGGYCGSLSNPPLQAYSDSNNSAFFSFHKGGVYAVNMGLDADSVLRIGGWSAAANRWQLDMSGNMTVAGDVTAYSDARVKENIETVEDALDKVLNLRGVYYNRTDSDDKRRKVGVIAQEILEVIPEVVGQDNDGMYNVSYGNIVGVLIEAIKEQQKQIDELKSKLN